MEQGKQNLKRFLKPVGIAIAVVFVLVAVVFTIQSRIKALKAKSGETVAVQTHQPKAPEMPPKPETAEKPPTKELPKMDEIRKTPSYPAPAYTLPGSRPQGTQRGQIQQKIEPSVPGSVEKPTLGETIKEAEEKKDIGHGKPVIPPGAPPTKEISPKLPVTVPGTAHHEDKHEEHVVLPEIDPIPGVTFVETMIRLMEYELKGRFLGWRPNDLIIGRFTDNVNNYQLGVLEAMRFTTLRLKDSLTRMGEADAYDRDLQDALNLFMNKPTQFWFPSAEASYGEAVEHLKRFVEKLKRGERKFYYRVDNLISLIISYNDLLGNVNRTLIMEKRMDGRPVSWFEVDDYFYYAKGVAHVMFEILKVVRVGFKEQLAIINATEIMDEILHELHRAEKMEPWIILDSDLDGIFANHRANLNGPLSEVAHLMTVMSRF
ncbi:MAG: DUF2333 family protein [Syntrophobacterales bacterium]|nr:DUF2333 family protein [Syntrophobacterales bacterium]